MTRPRRRERIADVLFAMRRRARVIVAAAWTAALAAQDPSLRVHAALDQPDGRWHGVEAIADGALGGAARFRGDGGRIDVGACGLTSRGSFTLRCQIRTTTATFCTPLMARAGEQVAISLVLGRAPGTLSFEAWSWHDVRIGTRRRVDDGRWHAVEAAYDAAAGVAGLWLDGELQGTAELGAGGAADAQLRLGDNIGARQPYAGDLDAVEVADGCARTAALRPFAPVLPVAEREQALAALRARLLPRRSRGLAADASAAWPARRAAIRAHVADCLGLAPPPPADELDVRVHGEVQRDGVRVQRLSWAGFPGQRATGWLWQPATPPDGPARRPAMLCPHGHWAHGARDPVVQARCASFAQFGWTTLAVDSVHVEDVASGVSSLGAMAWHDLQGLRVLAARDDVDPAVIGVTGASGGGQQTYYLMALSDAFAAAAPMVMACYFDAIVDDRSAHCGCNHPPRIAAGVDVPELCAVFAPKPTMFGSVTGDWTRDFPRQGLPELAAHWQQLGAPAPRARHADEPHNYDRPMREEVYGFLHDALLGPTTDGQPRARVAEPPFAPFAPQALQQLAAAGPSGAPDRAALVIERLARQPKVTGLAALAPGLDLTVAPRPIAWRDPDGAGWRKGTVTGSDDVPVPFRVAATARGGAWTLVVDPRGAAVATAEVAADGPSADASGHGPRAIVDPRPYGEWAPYRSAWQRNGLLLGRGEGYQAAVDVALVAASLPGDLPVLVEGRGEAGVVAVLAALLCPRIGGVRAPEPGQRFARDGNRLPLCPELLRWRDLPELVAALPPGCWQGPPLPTTDRR